MHPMPLQNRVTPFGEIQAQAWRGAFTGNRGCLHDDQGLLGTVRWRHKAWVCCLTEFRGRKRHPMPPGRWTALFFWDEAVALAAGHRPCGECRYRDHVAFREAWVTAGLPGSRAAEIDQVLHPARVRRDRTQVTHEAEAQDLPDGCFVALPGHTAGHLVWQSLLWALDPAAGGYARAGPARGPARVLTPRPIRQVLAAGYSVVPIGLGAGE